MSSPSKVAHCYGRVQSRRLWGDLAGTPLSQSSALVSCSDRSFCRITGELVLCINRVGCVGDPAGAPLSQSGLVLSRSNLRPRYPLFVTG